jgi:hypothetical protein
MSPTLASSLSPALGFACVGLALACATAHTGAPRVISPRGFEAEPAWTAEELSKDTAVRLLGRTEHESHHWLRTTVSEKPSGAITPLCVARALAWRAGTA